MGCLSAAHTALPLSLSGLAGAGAGSPSGPFVTDGNRLYGPRPCKLMTTGQRHSSLMRKPRECWPVDWIVHQPKKAGERDVRKPISAPYKAASYVEL